MSGEALHEGGHLGPGDEVAGAVGRGRAAGGDVVVGHPADAGGMGVAVGHVGEATDDRERGGGGHEHCSGDDRSGDADPGVEDSGKAHWTVSLVWLDTRGSTQPITRLQIRGDSLRALWGDAETPARGEGRRSASCGGPTGGHRPLLRSEEHTSELQSLMRISYAVLCLKKKNT